MSIDDRTSRILSIPETTALMVRKEYGGKPCVPGFRDNTNTIYSKLLSICAEGQQRQNGDKLSPKRYAWAGRQLKS